MNAAPLMLERRLDQRHELRLVAGKAARDERGAEPDRHADEIDRLVERAGSLLALRAAVGGGGELALGQPVNPVVLDDIDHVDAAPHGVGELAEPDRRGVAVAGDAEVDEVAIGEVGAGQHRRHAPVHRIEAVALAEHVGRRLGGAADAAQLGDPMRRQAQFEAGVDDRGADRVMPAAGAKRRHRPFVVPVGEAERVDRDRRDGETSAWRDRSFGGLERLGRSRLAQARRDFAMDVAGGGRHPVEVEDRRPAVGRNAEIGRDQRAHLRVAILLDHEDPVMAAR